MRPCAPTRPRGVARWGISGAPAGGRACQALRVCAALPRGLLALAVDGKASRLPGSEASLEVEHFLVARSEKGEFTLAGTRPDHAVESDAVRRVNFGDALRHLVEGYVDAAASRAAPLWRRSSLGSTGDSHRPPSPARGTS